MKEYSRNPRVEAIEGSTIRALNARKKSSSIDLGMGEPSLMPDMRFIEAAARWVGANGCRYTPNAGDPELRERIAAHYAYPGFDRAENALVTAGGSQESVYLAIKALLDPARDELLVVEPAFPVYAKVAAMEGIVARVVAMPAATECAFDVQRILAAVTPRTRMIVICSPCNPTARTIPREAVAVISRELLDRPGPPVYVLHDEVYRELTYVTGAGWFGECYPHTVSVNSLSKSNALTGMRLGWILAPRDVVPAIVKARAWITSSPNAFAQRVALEIFSAPGGLQEHAAWYREQRSRVVADLDAAGLRYLPIDGTFYACVHVGDGVDTLAFANRLIDEEDVVAIPGSVFGASLEGWLRCSWVAPAARVREGLSRIARLGRALANA